MYEASIRTLLSHAEVWDITSYGNPTTFKLVQCCILRTSLYFIIFSRGGWFSDEFAHPIT